MLQREREVGNVFRLFRNPDEEYDNYAAPTAIKVIDHDKQRWAMLTLGDVLAKTQVWSGERNDVTQDYSNFPHLRNAANAVHPLIGCRVIGDLDEFQLADSTIRHAVRSIERFLSASPNFNDSDSADRPDNIAKRLSHLCSNNLWYNRQSRGDPDLIFGGFGRTSTFGVTTEIGTSAATASVEEVAEALQTAMLEAVVADEPTPEITAKVNSDTIKTAIQDVVSITSDMSDAQRGSIASALVGAASGFKSSKSALRKVIRNKDEGKQPDVDAAFGEALKKDMASNWKIINREAKKIAANIGPTAEGVVQNSESAASFFFPQSIQRIETMGLSDTQRAIARWYMGCSIDLPTIVSLDQQGIVTPFGAYVSCIYFPIYLALPYNVYFLLGLPPYAIVHYGKCRSHACWY